MALVMVPPRQPTATRTRSDAASDGGVLNGSSTQRPVERERTPVREERLPDDLRLALVLNGGVSLAVWISGVVHELDVLRIARKEVDFSGAPDRTGTLRCLYGRLLKIACYEPHIDVIAGTSAGGINGALLAASIAGGREYGDVLRDAWIPLGDLAQLVVEPGRADSILDGDLMRRELAARLGERLTPPGILRDANRRGDPDPAPEPTSRASRGRLLRTPLTGKGDAARRPALGTLAEGGSSPISLILTATDIGGVRRDLRASSSRMGYSEHRLHFRFGGRTEKRPGWTPLVAKTADVLAQAARATASFPVAFAPVPLDAGVGALHDAVVRDGEPVPTEGRRWLMDGGVLDNSPFAPLLDELDRMPSHRHTERVVVFVVPYPDRAGEVPSGRAPTSDHVLRMARALPRQITTVNDFERLQGYLNSRRRRFEAMRRLMTICTEDELALHGGGLLRAYRRYRWVALVRGQGFDPQLLYRAGAEDIPMDRWVPEHDDLDSSLTGDPREWRWGTTPARRIGAFALIAIREAQAGLRPDADRDHLRRLNHRVNLALEHLARIREDLDRRMGERWWGMARGDVGRSTQDGIEFLEASNALWDDRLRKRTGLAALAIARALHRGWDDIGKDTLGERRDPTPEHLLRRLLLANLILDAGGILSQEAADERVVGFNLLRIDSSPWAGGGCMVENPVECIDADLESPAKLLGLSLHHFGGFLRAAWRANDWMWGRLDATGRLVDLLLEDARLRALYRSDQAGEIAAQLRDVVLSEDGESCWNAEVALSLQHALRNEVALVCPATPTTPVPFREARDRLLQRFTADVGLALRRERAARHQQPLSLARRAVVWRLQLEIFAHELPVIAEADRSEWLPCEPTTGIRSTAESDSGGEPHSASEPPDAPPEPSRASALAEAPSGAPTDDPPTRADDRRTPTDPPSDESKARAVIEASRYVVPLVSDVSAELRRPRVFAAVIRGVAGAMAVLLRRAPWRWKPLLAILAPFVFSLHGLASVLLNPAHGPWRRRGAAAVASLLVPLTVGLASGALSVSEVDDDFPAMRAAALAVLAFLVLRVAATFAGEWFWGLVLLPAAGATFVGPLLLLNGERVPGVTVSAFSVVATLVALAFVGGRMPTRLRVLVAWTGVLWSGALGAWAASSGDGAEVWVLERRVLDDVPAGLLVFAVALIAHAGLISRGEFQRSRRRRSAADRLRRHRGALGMPAIGTADPARRSRAKPGTRAGRAT